MTKRLMFAVVMTMIVAAGQPATTPETPPQTSGPAPSGRSDIDKFNLDHILVTRSLMSPKNVSDAFGRRIGRRYIALQVTVANRHPQYQWLVTDASVDMAPLLRYLEKEQQCRVRAQSLRDLLDKDTGDPTLTGADLTVLRGVAEKGQQYDPRNFTVRILQGSGTIAAGLMGVASFGPAFAPGVAAFNGPLINAIQRIFPDMTVNQLNRLNDSAYGANMLVPKQQAKIMVVFIPVAALLDKNEQAQFWKNPNAVYSTCADLRLLSVAVNGHPVAQLDLGPTVNGVEIAASERAKFGTDNFKVAGVLVGRNLDGASLALSGTPEGLTIRTTGTPTSEQIFFELSGPKPLPPNTPIAFAVRKAGNPERLWSTSADWMPPRPTIASGGLNPASIKQGEQKTVEISGSGFLPGSQLEIDDRKGLTLGDVTYVSTGKLKVDIAAAADAVVGAREIAIRTTGGVSGKATLTIATK